MVRAWMLVGFGLVFWALVAAAQETTGDAKQMEGTWSGSIIRTGGEDPTPEEKKLKFRLLVAGDLYQVAIQDDLLQVLMEGKFRIDPSQQPKTIDAVFGSGDMKGAVQKGIYSLKDDELIVTFGKPGDDRPRDFQTRAGSDESTVRYVREKK